MWTHRQIQHKTPIQTLILYRSIHSDRHSSEWRQILHHCSNRSPSMSASMQCEDFYTATERICPFTENHSADPYQQNLHFVMVTLPSTPHKFSYAIFLILCQCFHWIDPLPNSSLAPTFLSNSLLLWRISDLRVLWWDSNAQISVTVLWAILLEIQVSLVTGSVAPPCPSRRPPTARWGVRWAGCASSPSVWRVRTRCARSWPRCKPRSHTGLEPWSPGTRSSITWTWGRSTCHKSEVLTFFHKERKNFTTTVMSFFNVWPFLDHNI